MKATFIHEGNLQQFAGRGGGGPAEEEENAGR